MPDLFQKHLKLSQFNKKKVWTFLNCTIKLYCALFQLYLCLNLALGSLVPSIFLIIPQVFPEWNSTSSLCRHRVIGCWYGLSFSWRCYGIVPSFFDAPITKRQWGARMTSLIRFVIPSPSSKGFPTYSSTAVDLLSACLVNSGGGMGWAGSRVQVLILYFMLITVT